MNKTTCQYCRRNTADITFEDSETVQEVSTCKTCYLKVCDDANCEKNNCGNPAVDTDDRNEFVCKDHKLRELEN